MKIESAKKNLKIKLFKLLSIVVILGLLAGASYYYYSASEDELKKLEDENSSLSSEIQKKKGEYTKASENLLNYLKIPTSKLPTEEGYSENYQRLQFIIPELEKYKKLYLFKALNFSSGEIKPSAITSANFDLFENELTINFQGLTDEILYSFINDLKYTIPGYLKTTVIAIERKEEIDENSVAKYVENKDYHLVDGKIEFIWTTVKKRAE